MTTDVERPKAAGFVVLTFAFHKEERVWVGECRELSTSTYGRSLSQVQQELSDLVAMHLKALEEVAERERFFREHGIKFYPEGAPVEITLPVVDEAPFYQAHRFPVGSAA